MHTILLITVVVHVLAGVFWAGSTFALARGDGVSARPLAGPQMGAAGAAILAGLLLWYLTHRYGFDRQARILAIGAGCAIVAAIVHGAITLRAANQLAQPGVAEPGRLEQNMVTGERVAAGLLAVTVACMVIARYV
jgi:hypothetical protein